MRYHTITLANFVVVAATEACPASQVDGTMSILPPNNKDIPSSQDRPPYLSCDTTPIPGIWNEQGTTKIDWPPKPVISLTEVVNEQMGETSASSSSGIPGIWHEGATSYISWPPSSTSFSTSVLLDSSSPIPGIWNEEGTSYISWPPSTSPSGRPIGADVDVAALGVEYVDAGVVEAVSTGDDPDGVGDVARKAVGMILLYVVALVLGVAVVGLALRAFCTKSDRKAEVALEVGK